MFFPGSTQALGYPHPRHLGTPNINARVSYPVPPPASCSWPGQAYGYSRPGQGADTGRRSSHLAGQGCYSAGGPPAGSRGLLFPVFSCSEKDGRLTPRSRPSRSERFFKSHLVQNVTHSRRPPSHLTRRLVHINRFKGHIFSCPDCAATLAVPSVCFSRTALSVPRPSFRPFPVAQSVLPLHCCGSVAPASSGLEDYALSRRLADLRPVSRGCYSGHADSARPRSLSRLACQCGKEQPGALTADYISRHGAGLAVYDRMPLTSTSTGHIEHASTVPTWEDTAICSLSSPSGEIGGGVDSGLFGSVDASPVPDVAERLEPKPRVARSQVQAPTRVSTMPEVSLSVAERRLHHSRGSAGFCSSSPRGRQHRRISSGLGGDMAGADGTRHMVAMATEAPHQCPGADGSEIGAATLSPTSTRQTRSRQIRQHVCCIPYQSPRRHSVSGAGGVDHSDPDLGSSSFGQPEGHAHPRRSERVGRFHVPAVATTRGMETSSGGSVATLADLLTQFGQ